MTTRTTTATRPTAARTARTATALGALLLLTACGGDDTAPSAPAATTGTSSPTTSSAAPSPTTSDATTSAPSSTAAAGPDARDPQAELEVEDQRGDGSSVAVDEVRLSAGDGWVVVTGPDGAVLGSAAVARSDAEAPLTVPLDTPVTGGPEVRLVATLHLDDGDGALDPALDPVVVDEDRDDDGDDADDTDEDDLVRDAFDYRVG